MINKTQHTSLKHTKVGSIEVICGSMFSGKTEELLRRLKRAEIAQLEVQIFKPKTDTRYHDTDVVSHNANSAQAICEESASAILLYGSNAQVIGIDEAQFFDAELPNICQKSAALYSYRLICNNNQFLLGEKENYKPLCRTCHNNLSPVVL